LLSYILGKFIDGIEKTCHHKEQIQGVLPINYHKMSTSLLRIQIIAPNNWQKETKKET
jgi:hypothetical protein